MCHKVSVSVIIPAYQHRFFIREALESVLNQTYTDYELLISDDGSTDGTRDILREYEPRINGQIFYQEQQLGPVEQIHFLCRQAKGEYIALLNSDDYWEPTKLEKQVAFMRSNPEIAVCFTHGYMVDRYSQILGTPKEPLANLMIQPNRTQAEWLRFFWQSGNCLCHPSILAKREIYGTEICLNPSYRQLPDFDLWVRFISKYPVYIIQEPLTAHRRAGDENTSAQTQENTTRLFTEMSIILYDMLTNISDDLLLEAFGDLLPVSQKQKPENLDPERFFLMLNNPLCGWNLQVKAVQFFSAHALDKTFLDRVQKDYHFSINDFYKITAFYPSALDWCPPNRLGHSFRGEYIDMSDKIQETPNVSVQYEHEIPIMHCFDNNYVIPAAVSFYSMLSNADPKYFYKLYVLHTDITIQNQKKLTKLVEQFPNAKLFFVSMNHRFDDVWNDMPNTDHLSKEVLYKLVAPEIFPDFDRLVITDVDVLFLGDISQSFFALDGREDALFAGVRQVDFDMTFLRSYYETYRTAFDDNGHDQLKVCGGYLVANLKRQRELGMQEVFIDYLKHNGNRLLQAEQDVINMCCREKEIVMLPLEYVLCSYVYDCSEIRSAIATDPYYSYQDVLYAKEHPIQLHYATKTKPWNTPDSTKAKPWFDCLQKTGFFDDYKNKQFYQTNPAEKNVGLQYLPLAENAKYPVMVSILCCSYNQKKYIAKALDGILKQKTDYTYEIIIADDGSRDGTQDIIQGYVEKYPNKFGKVILREANVGIGKNYYEALCSVSGKYLAICDGDDYWADENKLQKQVDYLESHEDCAIVCSNFRNHREGTSEDQDTHFSIQDYANTAKTNFDVDDLIQYRFIASCTVMMRWRLHGRVPDFLQHYVVIDFPLALIHSSTGYIHTFSEEFSVYNTHEKGITQAASQTLQLQNSVVIDEVNQMLHYGLTLNVLKYRNRLKGISDSKELNAASPQPCEPKHSRVYSIIHNTPILRKVVHALFPKKVRDFFFIYFTRA